MASIFAFVVLIVTKKDVNYSASVDYLDLYKIPKAIKCSLTNNGDVLEDLKVIKEYWSFNFGSRYWPV